MIFDPITVCNLDLPNRFVRSATHEFMAEEDGKPISRLGNLYEELAKNEVGLIITGFSYCTSWWTEYYLPAGYL